MLLSRVYDFESQSNYEYLTNEFCQTALCEERCDSPVRLLVGRINTRS